MSSEKPSVLLICRRNGGKSQMADGLMHKEAGKRINTYSAGTEPGEAINQPSAESLLKVGVDIPSEHPKPIYSVGQKAKLPAAEGVNVEYWDTDEPSERGIECMRLIRDDITDRIQRLAADLGR